MENKINHTIHKYNNILTDLDSLFDTRLSLAYILDEKNIIRDIHEKEDKYRNRILDNFGNVSNDIFMQIYDKRSKYLLRNALPTNMLDYIKENYVDYNFNPISNNYDDTFTLYLNIYPYALTEEEQKNIVDSLNNFFGGIDICLIYKKFIEISPSFLITNKINIVVLYELTRWLELIVSEYDIMSTPLTHVYMVGPYYFNPKKAASKIDQAELIKFTEHLNMIAMTYLVPLKEFSAVNIQKEENN